MIRMAQVLDTATVKTLREALDDPKTFADGRATAGRAARAVKRNGQLARGPRHAVLAQAVERALRDHALFRICARPQAFVRLLFNRYGPGDAYGPHLDDPLIGQRRTDLSFTLFLSPPSTYDGGELVIEDQDGETDVKLEAGDLVLYPTTRVHWVTPVTAGVRLACVGWVRSLIRLEAHRDILFDLDRAADTLFAAEGPGETYRQIVRARDNLIRLWAED
ncbi:MAG: Fe2+-dependent dioxygenase [Alphaproteobacteria bacterium]